MKKRTNPELSLVANNRSYQPRSVAPANMLRIRADRRNFTLRIGREPFTSHRNKSSRLGIANPEKAPELRCSRAKKPRESPSLELDHIVRIIAREPDNPAGIAVIGRWRGNKPHL